MEKQVFSRATNTALFTDTDRSPIGKPGRIGGEIQSGE